MGILNIFGLLLSLAIAHQAIALSLYSSQFGKSQQNRPHIDGPSFSPFVQHSSNFWAYNRATNSWQLADISNLFSNGSWWSSRSQRNVQLSDQHQEDAIVGESFTENFSSGDDMDDARANEIPQDEEDCSYIPDADYPVRSQGRVSMVRFSEVSLWITGQSGAIYERFWNGVQWVVIPHDLPNYAGRAAAVLSVNRTMVAMSEAGILYQLQIDGHGQLVWVNCGPWLPKYTQYSGVSSSDVFLTKSGIVSADDGALYFATTDGSLTQLSTLHPIRWVNHHHPRGGDIVAVADAGTLRPGVIFTISTRGDLYEYDHKAKPAWKKHVREGSFMKDFLLAATRGVVLHGIAGAASASLFLLTKDHLLVERRFHQSKWRWLQHPLPNDDVCLSFSMGPSMVDSDFSFGKPSVSLFLTSQQGVLWEYKLNKPQANGRTSSDYGVWVSHKHPSQTSLTTSVSGVVLSPGRLFFPLSDGRIGELHYPGFGGGYVGPISGISTKDRKNVGGFSWSTQEAPETEGGNADYCTAIRGPSNCLEGTKDSLSSWQSPGISTDLSQRKRPGGKVRVSRKNTGVSRLDSGRESESSGNDLPFLSPWNQSVDSLFQLRTMQSEKSIFYVGKNGAAFERFFNGDTWLWLKHEHSRPLIGIVGVYSGGVFVLDVDNNLFLRERKGHILHWLNCSEIRGGRNVVSGSPWDRGLIGEAYAATVEDAVFLIDKNGNLMEFVVAMRRFAWHDCEHPPNAQVATIVDQESLRYRVVFVIGTDRKLYNYNRVTRQWVSHDQPPHTALSRIPGTAMRPSIQSTRGSLFFRSEDGGLVEFHWEPNEGWKWADHGLPEPGVYIATAPGPNVGNNRFFVVASDGRLFSRFWNDSQWAWFDHGHPKSDTVLQSESGPGSLYDHGSALQPDRVEYFEESPAYGNLKFGVMDIYVSFNGDCHLTIAPIRPIALSRSNVMVVLHDGRVASLKLEQDTWKWGPVHDTPTSSCQSSYWAASPAEDCPEQNWCT